MEGQTSHHNLLTTLSQQDREEEVLKPPLLVLLLWSPFPSLACFCGGVACIAMLTPRLPGGSGSGNSNSSEVAGDDES